MGEEQDVAWPDFTTPVDPGQGEPAASPSGTPSDPAPADGQPLDAGAPATGVPPAAGEPEEEYFERFPKRRLLELVTQRNEALASAKTLQEIVDKVVAAQRGGQPAGQPTDGQPAAPDPKKQAILARLYEVAPELKGLIERAQDVLAAAEMLPQQKQQIEARWNVVAQRTIGTLFDNAAKTLLGDGKTGKDLTPVAQRRLHADFSHWCMADQSRVTRYENEDPALVGEFLAEVRATYVDPLRRAAVAPAVARAKTAAALPQAGGAAPVATPQPKPNLDDEDAVHARGWAVLQEQRAAR